MTAQAPRRQATAGAGRETGAPAGREKLAAIPTPWPFPEWNGRKVPRWKVARQMPRKDWEEAPF